MKSSEKAARMRYEAPEALAESDDASPTEMRTAYSEDISQLSALHEKGVRSVAVQGPVSSMKTFLLTCTAEEFLHRARRITVLTPQRVNRRTVSERLGWFGVPFIEHPSRLDLCTWVQWREMVGRVDEQTCSTNGCPFYPEHQDIEQLAARALASHRLQTGGNIRLDEQSVKDLAAGLDQQVCPHYLREAMVELLADEETVQVATYAKSFADADAPKHLSADVALLDESHTVAADNDRTVIDVDLPAVTSAATAVFRLLNGTPEKTAREVASDLSPLVEVLGDWEKRSRGEPVEPDQLFEGTTLTLTSAFDVLHRADDAVMSKLSRAVSSSNNGRAERLSVIYSQLRELKTFMSRVKAHREGDLDFIHTQYEAHGESTNEIAFRRVIDTGAASTAREVYEVWKEEGTHPAIAARWGDLLDHYIEAVWTGRTVVPGSDRDVPGKPPTPLAELQSITGADTLIGYSATHNEASDPTRSPNDLRRTAHKIVTAPLQLRSEGDDRPDFHGRTSIDAATPWFQELVQGAKAETGDKLVAVPTNAANANKWEGMPVEALGIADGEGEPRTQPGLVPNSQAAIGEKSLEEMEIDAVLCGVQVQNPADTARRVIALWGQLAPDHDDPLAALNRGWRLLAQHAISGTIQAAGRFRSIATNIIFDRSELVELAGFEYERLTPSMKGFAGEFARRLEERKRNFQRRRDAVRAAKTVRYLEREQSKSPTRTQYLSTFNEMYGGTNREAALASEAAVEDGKLEYKGDTLRKVASDEAGDKPSG